jgi:hypothetical protein
MFVSFTARGPVAERMLSGRFDRPECSDSRSLHFRDDRARRIHRLQRYKNIIAVFACRAKR